MSSQSRKELRAKLEAEILNGEWKDFTEHLARNAVFVCAPDLILADVGLALASDSVKEVEAWLSSGQLARPTTLQMKQWSETAELPFRFLIVQPYVLIQPAAN